MQAVTISSVPKMAYSDSGTFLASRCTAHVKAPPRMLATISQPLWRKKVARCSRSVAGLVAVSSADIGVGHYGFSRVQGSDFRKRNSRSFPCSSDASRDPFVGGVRLGDVARPEHHAGNAALRQHRRVAEIIHPRRTRLARRIRETADQRQLGIRFQRTAGSAASRPRSRALRLAVPATGPQSRAAPTRFGLPGQRAAVHGDGAMIRHDVRLRAAADHPHA